MSLNLDFTQEKVVNNIYTNASYPRSASELTSNLIKKSSIPITQYDKIFKNLLKLAQEAQSDPYSSIMRQCANTVLEQKAFAQFNGIHEKKNIKIEALVQKIDAHVKGLISQKNAGR